MSSIGVIGDIHGNIKALDYVLAHAKECTRWWCIGDIVGYGPNPSECVERVRETRMISVAGNHDLGAVGEIDITGFNPAARYACEWTGGQMGVSQKDFIESLPRRERPIDGVLLVHGSPRDPVWEYVLSSGEAVANFGVFEESICFNGHTHAPAVFRALSQGDIDRVDASCELLVPRDGSRVVIESDRRYLINVGSVGQPRDGDPRSCYVVFDTEARTVSFHRIEYPVSEVQRRMEEVGLPEALVHRLAVGR